MGRKHAVVLPDYTINATTEVALTARVIPLGRIMLTGIRTQTNGYLSAYCEG